MEDPKAEVDVRWKRSALIGLHSIRGDGMKAKYNGGCVFVRENGRIDAFIAENQCLCVSYI